MAGIIILPALRKAVSEFEDSKQRSKEKVYKKHHRTIIEKSSIAGDAYRSALKTVQLVIAADFRIDPETLKLRSDIVRNINQELEIEKNT